MFYAVLQVLFVYSCRCVELSACYFDCGIPETQKGKFSFYAIIMNNKFIFVCVCVVA